MPYYFARLREIDHSGSIYDPGVTHTIGVLLKADSLETAFKRAEELLVELYDHEMEAEHSEPDLFGRVRLDVVWTWDGGAIEGYVDTVQEISEADYEVLKKYPTAAWNKVQECPARHVGPSGPLVPPV